MSWQAATFAILGAILLGGLYWYERSRPTAQVVALVAALAALGVAGRLAFAALPNVVATTDIVIFAGFALGPAPGFAVGALSGLVSNFWLGQGPWTPWQMAAWGLCGVFGAALGVRGRRVGRLELAAACALAGVAYGALLNFSLMATYGGDLSMRQFLALEARAIPFDAAHAIGNAVLALVAGPAMVRSLMRFRERFEWRRAAVASLAVAALASPLAASGSAQAAGPPGVDAAASWLVDAQNGDGGWGSSAGDASRIETTCWAMLALEASGRNPLDVATGGQTGVDFLRENLGDLSTSGDFARTILALEGAGVNAHSFGGRNLVAALAKRRRSDGSFEEWPGTTAFAVIALQQAGATGGLERSRAWLAGVQNADGGWGDVPGSPSTADGTAAVMQAMPRSEAAQRGLAYLRQVQLSSGGFPLGQGGPANSQSTAWAVQAIVAAGADANEPGPGGKSALDFLAARQAADGHYRYSASSDQTPVWVTGQVLPAAAGKPFPISPPARVEPVGSGGPAGLPPSAAPTETADSPSSTSDFLESLQESGVPSSSVPPGVPESFPSTATPGAPDTSLPESPAPGASAASPEAGSVPLPSMEAEPPPPAEPFTLSERKPPQPWTPLGVGLGVGGLALGSVILLGRRFGW